MACLLASFCCGLITILLGWAVARGGGNRLARKISPALLARRLGAAAVMCLAIVLHLMGGTPR